MVSGNLVYCIFELEIVFFCPLISYVLELIVVNILHIMLIELVILRKLVPEWNKPVFDFKKHDTLDSEFLKFIFYRLLFFCFLRG